MMAIMSDDFSAILERLPGVEKRHGAGEAVFLRGDAIAALHWVRHGMVHVARHLEDGATLIIQRAGPGDLVSEPSLHAQCYHCDAAAALPTVTKAIDAAAFRAELAANPVFSNAWTRHLAREVQNARARAEMLTIRTVEKKLDAWLALNGGVLPEKGEWKALAGEIATSPEALYREIARRPAARR